MSEPPIKFAADRECQFSFSCDDGVPGEECLRSFPALRRAWEFSKTRLDLIRDSLRDAGLPVEVATVAVVGSLGRMDATANSDCDLIVILTDAVDLHSPQAESTYQAVWDAVAPLKLTRPRPDGIYAAPTNCARLFDPATLGKVDEDLHTFGTRFQFLLETQPVYGANAFERITQSVVERYAKDYVGRDSRHEWTYLLNDLMRYYRSLCINYQWESIERHGKWRLRNIKARHSRLIMYAGLLFLLGESSRETADKVNWLQSRLKLTPLERIAHVYAAHGDPHFNRVLDHYEVFVEAVSDSEFRTRLSEDEPLEGRLPREANSVFEKLMLNSEALTSELLRFLLDRREDWSRKFIEAVVF